jgi:hypothetical protein
MFNLAIDSKLRGCDVVTIRVGDVAAGGYGPGLLGIPGPLCFKAASVNGLFHFASRKEATQRLGLGQPNYRNSADRSELRAWLGPS